MKVLLNEQLPVKLKFRFDTRYNVTTGRDMQWLGIKDQQLFLKLKENNFNAFLTNDQNFKFQLNSNKLTFSFINVNFYSNRYEDLITLIPGLNDALAILKETLLSASNEVNKIYVLTNGKLMDWVNLNNRIR
ncbi:MAG TPA: hypothetical protein VF623_02085 [Segetibacter sp.]